MNTEEGLQGRSGQYDSSPTMRAYLKWSPGEWAYESAGAGHFEQACAMLAAAALSDEEEGDFDAHREKVYDEAIGALEDLEAEGAFGRGAGREALTVFFTSTDSDDAKALEHESARRINPGPVFRRFAARWGEASS